MIGYTVFDSVIGVHDMLRARAPRKDLRAFGLIHEMEQFADGLRLISLGLAALEIKQGSGITACANEISKRLDALKALLSAHR